jgi:hypothetical protein
MSSNIVVSCRCESREDPGRIITDTTVIGKTESAVAILSVTNHSKQTMFEVQVGYEQGGPWNWTKKEISYSKPIPPGETVDLQGIEVGRTESWGFLDTKCWSEVSGKLDNGATFRFPGPNLGYPSPCFVTTAAYGDPDHAMVREFRLLRDQVLADYRLGQRFIGWYNHRGPQLASVIEGRWPLQMAAKAVLTPLALAIRSGRRTVTAAKYLTSALS